MSIEKMPQSACAVTPQALASAGVHRAGHNPFSTRYTRPGAVPYSFPPGVTAADLLARLAANGWQGEIVGPHGSGKSTLLAALLPELARVGRAPLLITLHDDERSLARHRVTLAAARADAIVIIDGYEQLARLNKWRLRRFCRRRGAGLLVTAHAPTGLPHLVETLADARAAQAVFDYLSPDPERIAPDDLAIALASHPGNLRDALEALYDLYELRRAAAGG